MGQPIDSKYKDWWGRGSWLLECTGAELSTAQFTGNQLSRGWVTDTGNLLLPYLVSNNPAL